MFFRLHWPPTRQTENADPLNMPSTNKTAETAPIAGPLATATSPGVQRPDGALPPAIVLGGGHNALSIARRLSARGVKVHALNHPGSDVTRSRHANTIRLPGEKAFHIEAEEYLLGST